MKSINNLWNWFQDNNKTIQNLIHATPTNQKQISFWLSKQLGYHSKELNVILVFPKKKTKKNKLIITANGNADYFNQAIKLVDNAPIVKDWKFTAFIDATSVIDKIINGLDNPYIYQDITLKSSESKFIALDNNEEKSKLDLMVYLKNYTLHCENKTLQQAIFIIILDLLGEKLLNNINFLQLAQIPINYGGQIYLYDMQFFIDEFNADSKY